MTMVPNTSQGRARAGLVARRPAAHTAPQNPYAAIIAGLPQPLTTGQVSQQAQATLNPLIAQLTQQINQRAAAQAQAVQGYTGQLVRSLASVAPNAGVPYAQAEAATSAANQSLADRLQGGGQSAGQDLASRLASINAPGAVDPAVAAAQQYGAGAGNGLYAGGVASLGQLAAQKAAAETYAGKLPGIASLGGIQQAGQVRGQAASDLAQGITQLEGQLPGIIGDLRSMSEQRATNLAGAQENALKYQQDLTAANALAKYRADTLAESRRSHAATAAENRRSHTATEAENKRRDDLAATKSQAALIIANGIDPATGTLTAGAQQALGRLLGSQASGLTGVSASVAGANTRSANSITAANTRAANSEAGQNARTSATIAAENARNNASIKAANARSSATIKAENARATASRKAKAKAAATKAKTGFSSSLLKEANRRADVYYNGVPAHQHYNTSTNQWEAVPGTGQDYTPYPEALQELIALKPNDPAWAAAAQKILDSRFKEGEGGRPYSPGVQHAGQRAAGALGQGGNVAAQFFGVR